MFRIICLLCIFLGMFHQVHAQKKYSRQRAIGLYTGFNASKTQFDLKNSAIDKWEIQSRPEAARSWTMGFQGGLQYIGRKPEITLFAAQVGLDFFSATRNYNGIAIGQTSYERTDVLAWREFSLGFRVIRLFGYYYNKTIPIYFDVNYNRLRGNDVPIQKSKTEDINLNISEWRLAPKDLSHGFSAETGLYLKYFNIGFKYTFYPSIFNDGAHELSDGVFTNLNSNPAYIDFDKKQHTSLSKFEIKARFNLYLLTWGRCSAGHEGFSIGHHYNFDYFWKAAW